MYLPHAFTDVFTIVSATARYVSCTNYTRHHY
jgi:hypothetical protein